MARNCKVCGADTSGHRPYAKRQTGVPSVSTISSLLDDGKSSSFGWAASAIAAEFAVHYPEALEALAPATDWTDPATGETGPCDHKAKQYCPRCQHLRRLHSQVWSGKADLGTHVHHLAMSWALGESIDVDPQSESYIDALERFYLNHEPDWARIEVTVLYDEPKSHAYTGQYDADGTITYQGERRSVILDIKTGNSYAAEHSLQLAGYRYAQWLTTYDDKGAIASREPMPTFDMAATLILQGDGTYRLVDLPANRTAHGTFLRLRDAWSWLRDMKKWEKDNATPEQDLTAALAASTQGATQ